MTIIVCGAPSQSHGQGVGEGLMGVSAGGQADGLDILTEGHRSLEGEDGNVVVEAIGSEVWMSDHLLHLEFL